MLIFENMEIEIQVWQQAILGDRVFREYHWDERGNDKNIFKSRGKGIYLTTN